MKFNRRHFVFGVGSSASSALVSNFAHAQWPGETYVDVDPSNNFEYVPGLSGSPIAGCCLYHNQADQFASYGFVDASLGLDTMNFSMSPAQRKAFGRALVRVSETIGVRPGFSFIDDGRRPNAYATAETKVDGTWGSVLYGKNLFLRQLESHDDEGVSVVAIAAHEFGHILQFRSGYARRMLEGQKTVKLMELQADYIAGFYLGRQKRLNPGIRLTGAGRTFERLGDTSFNNRNHHGTSSERIAAAEAGFKLGFDSQSVIKNALLPAGESFVRANFT